MVSGWNRVAKSMERKTDSIDLATVSHWFPSRVSIKSAWKLYTPVKYSRFVYYKRMEMTIFDEYKTYTGDSSISPSLLWEYDLSHFDWWKSRKIVVQRVIERGWLKDFYAAFNLYGGIEGFREIIKELPSLSPRDMNFVCIVFNLEKEELKCYTRKLSREKHLNS